MSNNDFIIENGVLTKYTGNGGDVVIPDGVTSIGQDAFRDCTGLTGITIPDSVTSIGDSAFCDCKGLTSITIPDSVTSIGDYAFHNCVGLTGINIPDSVTSIGKNAFCLCKGLTSVTISDSVTSIGDSAFYGCKGLTSITIPDNVTSIGDSAFRGCKGLTSITIPDSVKYIVHSAFSGCKGLTSITIPDSVKNIGMAAFSGCDGLTSITIPDSVTSIDGFAFENSTGLTSIIIGNSVTSIGNHAFRGCTGLTSIEVNEGNTVYHSAGNCLIETESKTLIAGCKSSVIPDDGSVTSIGYGAFWGCTGLTSITIPDSVTNIDNYAFFSCNGLTSVTIGNSVTNIGERAFQHCTGLTSITIPYSVTSIDIGAFGGCTGLTNIIIGNSVTSIGDEAFSYCTGLTSVTIPDSVTSIGRLAFNKCIGLTSVTIGNSVTSIGRAFEGCIGLTSIEVAEGNTVYHSAGNCLIETESKTLIWGFNNSVIPDDGSVTSIDVCAFRGCIGLTSVTIPDSVTSIGYGAFECCTELTGVTIGNSVTSIGEHAFYRCAGLTNVKIPDSVESIDRSAFEYCTGLTGVTIGNSVTNIGKNAFYGCTGLTEATIPSSVTSIGDYAFGCTGLTSISIPDSMKTLGVMAFKNCESLVELKLPNSALTFDKDMIDNESAIFQGCSSLTSVTIPGTIKTVPSKAFRDCSGLRKVVIEDGVTTIENAAFYDCVSLESVTIPKSIKKIESSAFSGCEKLKNAEGYIIIDGWLLDSPQAKSLTIPNGVETITENSLHSGTEYICFPDSVKMIEENPVGFGWGNPVSNIPEGYLQQTVKLPDNVTGRLLKTDSWKEQVTDKDYAALYLFQLGKNIQQFIKDSMDKEPDKKLKLMCDILSKGGKTAYFTKAVDYCISHKDDISSDTVNTLIKILNASKMKPLAEKLNSYLTPGKEKASENAVKIEDPIFIYKSIDRFDANSLFKNIFGSDDIKKIKLPTDKKYMTVIDKHEFTVKTLISKRMKNRFEHQYYEMYDAFTAISTMRSKEEVLEEIDRMDPMRHSDAFMLAAPEFKKDLPELSEEQIELRKKFIASVAYLISDEKVINQIAQLVPKKKNGTFMKGRTIRIAGSGMAFGKDKVLDIYGKTTSDLTLEIYFDERYVKPDDLALMSEDYVCTHTKSLGLSEYINAE